MPAQSPDAPKPAQIEALAEMLRSDMSEFDPQVASTVGSTTEISQAWVGTSAELAALPVMQSSSAGPKKLEPHVI